MISKGAPAYLYENIYGIYTEYIRGIYGIMLKSFITIAIIYLNDSELSLIGISGKLFERAGRKAKGSKFF